jgi:hypothetical protein
MNERALIAADRDYFTWVCPAAAAVGSVAVTLGNQGSCGAVRLWPTAACPVTAARWRPVNA